MRSEGERIDAWLRAACAGRDDRVGLDPVDMSAAAITDRIRELAEMSSLCLELAELERSRPRE